MKVRLTQAWKTWPIGHVIPEMPANVARSLIARGIAEEVTDEDTPKGGLLSRMMSSPADRMMKPAVTRRAK